MTNLIVDNQTVSRGVYGIAIREMLPIPESFILSQAKRIDRAYAMGEPLWMIADELRVRYDHRPSPIKTPGELAIRRVRL